MADFSKQIAVLALAVAAGCSDSFPPAHGPLDRFYFPLGMAVRPLGGGKTALLVVSTNFDLRYDADVGGAVVAVDPDRSGNALAGDPSLAVLGGLNIGSFGGEIGWLDGSCAQLSPALAPGHARVVVPSRGTKLVYALDMDGAGGLACDGCALSPIPDALDPYGVTMVCDQLGTGPGIAQAFVTHLRAPSNAGYVTRVDLQAGTATTMYAGIAPTYTSAYSSGRLFVSSRLGTPTFSSIAYFDAFLSSPPVQAVNLTAVVRDGVLPGKMVFSADGALGYLALDLVDASLWATTGVPVATGGAMAVFDMRPGPYGVPLWGLLRMTSTCLGGGQLDLLPPRPGQRDLLAITCPNEGTLLLYDDQVGAVTARVGLDPKSGAPLLGRQPIGLAHQSLPASRCASGYCARIYVASFDQSWVSLVELDLVAPQSAAIVQRLGRERD